MSEPLLDVRALRVALQGPRGAVWAVDDVTLEVSEGEALGLVGESGCGKTTTLRAVAGLLPRDGRVASGEIRFDGADLTSAPGKRREVLGRSLSMVFQDPGAALDPVMRVGEQIAEGPRAHLGMSRSQAREHALSLMRDVGISDPVRRARAYPHQLSGGMCQRVMIAIAIACEPRLVLCDEPTTAVDVTIQDQILRLLRGLRRERGVAMILVTHDLPVVAQTCGRVAVMYAGKIVETGPVAEVFAEPRHPYTQGLLRSAPSVDSARRAFSGIPGVPADLASPPPGCRFHPRCPIAIGDCGSGEFPLRQLGSGRATACIRAEAVQGSFEDGSGR